MPTLSTRLVKAAAAEREELDRHRERLLAVREQLRTELAAIEQSLQELDERQHLLNRLTGAGHGPAVTEAGEPADRDDTPRRAVLAPLDEADRGPSSDRRRAAGAEPGTHPRRHDGGDLPRVLKGPAIRRAAVEVLLAQRDRPEALHYRRWFELVRSAGFAVAGKDPLAVFLTQLSRSPVIRKGTQAGIYELDVAAPARLGIRLDRLHEELRRLTSRPEATADLAVVRAEREQLTLEINQTEKALEEAEATLAAGRASTVVAAAS